MSWNPQQYLKFAGERLRPALDLMARIDLADPRRCVAVGGADGKLPAKPAARRHADRLQRHRQQAARNLLAR